jgi:UrcA family protein
MTALAPRRAAAAACALAVLPMLALAGAARAESIHVKYGDLSRPDQAAAFNRRLEIAAHSLCDNIPLSAARDQRVRQCRDGVREEAMDQLSRVQQGQLASYERGLTPVRLAGAR